MTRRGWVLICMVGLIVAVGLLIAQGDPCDTANDPAGCRVEVPNR